MMVKKQQRNLMTENKPNEYPRTVLPASGGNVRRPIRSFAGAPAVEISSRNQRALILEFLLFLADTNSFAGASNGGPLLNLDHREDSINSNGLPAPVSMLADELTGHDWFSMMPTDTSPKVCKVLLLFHLRQINNHHPHAEYGHQVDPRPDRALNALNQLGSIQRKINGSSAAFSKGGNSKLDVPKHCLRALVPPRGTFVPQPP
ncbi:pre-mRNA splicing factor prp17 [Culex quinquefasciatus]|uniref:Pre-mRNA splicing factor prp17 n=1 Tax=Culex quinquefasciatus TaxID=7176 RepID=B0X9S4_CULQU|nr:pre-mRNA splicing factor prp17 [Culex quinquefasciatus]|eukprot:XP_001866396.1 pre-mRNA splicing factor prp17 [Culex quinquefasciatus]